MRRSGAVKRYCKHGNLTNSYICPECANEVTWTRQARLDRASFKARIRRITGQDSKGAS